MTVIQCGLKFSNSVMEKIPLQVLKLQPSFFSSEPSPPHNSQRIDANTDATNNTTKTTLFYTTKHNQTQTPHPFPTQIHAHFIPSGTRLAQLCQDSCFVHDANMFAKQGMSQSTGTLTLSQVRAGMENRESQLDERSLSLSLRGTTRVS